MKKLPTLAFSLAALAAVLALPLGGNGTTGFFTQQIRAGTAAFAVGQEGINITFKAGPMPDTNYAVVVQPTNTAGYSGTSDDTYFNPLHKRTDGFEVQFKRCQDGVGVPIAVDVSLDWIAVEPR
ncbi:MAG TPA: hypothetical protein VN345_13340 [Blastocatellia bacterium]|jgi:hypothetical protein|nr:hypothetical protein [Blastocatellia bacterium]